MDRVLVIGELCLDIIAHGPKSVPVLGEPVWASDISLTPGGSVFYTGCAFHALGLDVSIRAAVGDDRDGERLISELSENGLDTSGIRRVKGESTQKCIAICKNQDKRFVACSPPLGDILGEIDFSGNLKLIYVAGYLLYPEMWGGKFAGLLSKAREKAVRVVIDTQMLPVSPDKIGAALNPEILRNVDALILNSEEAEFLTGEGDIEKAAEKLSDSGASVIVVKLGESGSMAYEKGKITRSKAFPVKVRDTMGAGDIFGAAFSYGLLEGWKTEKTLDFANAAAALGIADRKGEKKAPKLDEVLDFLSERAKK